MEFKLPPGLLPHNDFCAATCICNLSKPKRKYLPDTEAGRAARLVRRLTVTATEKRDTKYDRMALRVERLIRPAAFRQAMGWDTPV